MPSRTAPFIPDHYYHLYNRGVNRQPIFLGEDNWRFFINRLREYFQNEIAEIVAYCLMPTHYHVLALIKTDDFPARVMQTLSVSYTKAVNKQQNRVGPLFQGPFRAVLVDSNDYLLQLARYIHLNPTAAGLVTQPEEWLFSSYRDAIGMRNGTLANSQIILEQFPSVKEYQKYVVEGRDDKIDKIAHLILED
jgi:putative transposase